MQKELYNVRKIILSQIYCSTYFTMRTLLFFLYLFFFYHIFLYSIISITQQKMYKILD